MNSRFRLFFLFLGLLACATDSSAALMVYTFSGSAEVRLNGSLISNHYKCVFMADTGEIRYRLSSDGVSYTYINSIINRHGWIEVDGGAKYPLDSSMYLFVNRNYPGVGFGITSDLMNLNLAGVGFEQYQLDTPFGPVTDNTPYVPLGQFSCDGGKLITLANISGVTFQAQWGVLQANPERLSFLEGTGKEYDVVRGGTPPTLVLTLTNVSTSTIAAGIRPSDLSIVGPAAADFQVWSMTPSTPQPLAPGNTVTVVIRFYPRVTQRTLGLSAELLVNVDTYTNPVLRVPLVGDAVPVTLSSFTAN